MVVRNIERKKKREIMGIYLIRRLRVKVGGFTYHKVVKKQNLSFTKVDVEGNNYFVFDFFLYLTY